MSYLIKSVDVFSHQGFAELGVVNHYNEDRVVAGTRTFAVVDGATSLVAADMGGMNPSAYTAYFLAGFLHKWDDSDLTAEQLLVVTNKAFAKHLQEEWPEVLQLGKLGPCAAVALCRVMKDGWLSFANMADCSIVVEAVDGWQIVSEHNARHAELDKHLADEIFAKMALGMSSSEAKKLPEIVELCRRNRMLLNVEYGVFNAEPEVPLFIKSCRMRCEDCRAVAIFSDGFVWPDATSEQEGCLKAAAMMREFGCFGYYTQLKALRDADPMFKRFLRLKHMDDASGMMVVF